MKYCFVQITLIFIGIIMCFSSNCKKPHPDIIKGPYYLGEAKDYLYFKPGSYWVYLNSVTSQLDTITMVKIDTSTKNCDIDLPAGHYFATYTDITYTTYSSLLKGNISHYLYPPAANNFGYSIDRRYIHLGFPSVYNIINFPMHKPQDTNQTYSAIAVFFATYYNFNSGPYHFDSAVQLRTYDQRFWPQSNIFKTSLVLADHYWVKNFGLVKMNIQSYYPETKESWELINYNLIK